MAVDHESYRQYHEEVSRRQLSNNEAYDKAILSLSSAGLALSLTFFRFVVPIEKAVCVSVLEKSWILFLAAIICTLLSFASSQAALKKELEYAEKYYLQELEEYESKANPAGTATDILNTLAGIFFVCALAGIVYFVTQNI